MIKSTYLYITVSDFDRSGRWYAENLGMKWNSSPEHNWEIQVCAGTTIYMKPLEEDRAVLPNSLPILGILVPDIEKLHEELRNKGVQADELKTDFGGTVFNAVDPDGNRIEIWGGWPVACDDVGSV